MPEVSSRKENEGFVKVLQAYQTAVNEAAIVSITDKTGKILYVNDQFISVSKYTIDELIGQKHRIINSGYHPKKFFKEMWEIIKSGKHWRGEIKNKAKDGSYFWVDTLIIPVFDEQNNIFQFLSIRNLITKQKENEEKLVRFQQELIKRERQLKDAQHVAKTGSWHLDLLHNSLEWSEETYRIFELPFSTVMSYEDFLERVHPNDQLWVNEKWEAALKGAPYEIEHRIITTSGEKWVRERARIEFDKASNVVAAIGTVQDITEKKKTENILRESESLYKNLFNNSPFPNSIVDKETLQVLEINETATHLYGYTREEFLQLTSFDIRVPEEHDKLRTQLETDYAWDKSVRTHRKKDGTLIQIEPFITEINYKGKPAYLITINDVTEKLKLQEQLIKEKVSRQKEVTRAALEAQEKNRAEIGRELHDNINQLLVASGLYLKNIKPAIVKEKMCLEKSMEIIATAITEIRKLSQSLVPPSLKDLSLTESIEDLLLNFKLTEISVDFDLRITENLLPEGLKISIYRIIQEQFNNIIKYAEATKVVVTARQYDSTLYLEIFDNGKGFDMKQKPRGIGLTNIIHRAEIYNGKVLIESSPGKGCRLQIEFVLKEVPSSF